MARKLTMLINQARYGKAMQTLLSTGVAEATETVHAILQAMHPDRQEPLRPHRPSARLGRISVNSAYGFLRRIARSDRTTRGVYGWSAEYLAPIAGTPFMRTMARLISAIANAQMPAATAMILTAGGLFALNKENAQQQAITRIKGLPQSIRPINVGCCLLKWAFQLALRTPKWKKRPRTWGPSSKGWGRNEGWKYVPTGTS